MAYRVRFDPVALRNIEDFAAYLRDYSEDFSTEQIERLDRIIARNLGESSLRGAIFRSRERLTGLTCSASVAARSIGLFTPWTKRRAPWTSCISGTRCGIRKAWRSRPSTPPRAPSHH